uniref:CYP4CB1 n=1 Tax=Liposcelis bostrychophila TaxID=185214 RepID=B6DEP1_LIPBO|nr:CYP4CB1 [Liposcelis bostrychophila]
MLGLLILLVIIFALVIGLDYYNHYKDPRRIIDRIFPGPFRIPIVGNALIAACSREAFYRVYLNLSKSYDYKPFRLWFLKQPYVFISDYENTKKILSSNDLLDKAEDYRYFEPWLGQGLLTSKGDKWRRDRKIITPAFHFQILHRFFQIFYDNGEIFCEKLTAHDGGDVFDVFEYIEMLTLDNLCNAALKLDIQAQLNPFSALVCAIQNMGVVIYNRIFTLWLRYDAMFRLSSTARLQKKCLEIIHGNDVKIIRERKEEMKTKQPKLKTMEFDEKEKVAFLDLLLEMQDDVGYTDEDIREQLDTFMFAGHDTVTATLGFLIYSLAEHPDVQEKVYRELLDIYGESERCPNFSDLQDMKYTEQVIKETLRLYTVVTAVARRVEEDFELSEHQVVPKGVEIVLLLSALHRNPEIFPNPDIFDPDRFSPEVNQERDSFAFVPFSAGSRNCIGQKFAMHEMKITVYKIVKKFKLSISDKPEDKVRTRTGVVLSSTNGIRIKVQSRKKKTPSKLADQ